MFSRVAQQSVRRSLQRSFGQQPIRNDKYNGTTLQVCSNWSSTNSPTESYSGNSTIGRVSAFTYHPIMHTTNNITAPTMSNSLQPLHHNSSLTSYNTLFQQARFASTKPQAADNSKQIAMVTTGIVGATGLAYMVANNQVSANMADEGLHPPAYPWYHSSPLHTFDHAAIRRGYQVYREVCSACHSLDRIAWRNLIDVSHSEDEVKAMAEEVEYEDGPDDNGDMFQRPGKPSDYMPRPYANEEAARAGNAGALPPDLSLMIKARHGGADYVFSLLTGYVDAPAGVEVREGLNYNPYFPGGAIAMARVLFDGLVEYEDGTPATASQMARDVTTFLAWASEPEHDDRKKMGMKAAIILSGLTLLTVYIKRFKWAPIKSRKIVYNPPK